MQMIYILRLFSVKSNLSAVQFINSFTLPLHIIMFADTAYYPLYCALVPRPAARIFLFSSAAQWAVFGWEKEKRI